MQVKGWFDVAQVIGILTFHYQLQFLVLPKHLCIVNRYSWPTSNAPSVTFVLALLINGVATLTWPSVGVKPNTWKSWEFGVPRDSRMFRARQKGAKHLALGCSWCHWKGLETYISKMSSHWQFGHLQPKLWAKEGPGVEMAVWLPTTKSRESMSFRCPIRECDTPLERSRRGLQLWFRPRRDPTL
jgi:hypothetical protein